MKSIRLAIVALLALGLAHAALAADRREERRVSGFHAVLVAANMELEIIEDGTESLVLEGDADALDKLDTFVWDQTLHLDKKREAYFGPPPKSVHGVLHVRVIDELMLSGSGRVVSPSLEGDGLGLGLTGAGEVEIAAIRTNTVSILLSGSGRVRIAGHAEEVEAQLGGTGDIAAGKLESARARVSLSGAGNVTVWARQKLDATVSGTGSVRYYGDPAVTKSVRGVGSVTRVGANP